ncbi:MAG TPA: OB-fold domain-containing protein [Mycobacteriales bacterium]|nr:OB-fold domain-containing protein [Mycobacteriales bacterium]
MTEVLVADHAIEYTYTRSTGPIIGAFLAGLRDRRFVGIRAADGRVLVPPVEYDPVTSEDLTELVDVAETGVVTTWSWNDKPLAGQPLDRPFAWALVRLDGADTGLLAAVDVAREDMHSGLRVHARWSAQRVGSIRDLVCFEVCQDEHAAKVSADTDNVEIVETPIRLDFSYTPGIAASRFLRSVEKGEIVGQRCPKCQKVYVPPRGACSMCGVATDEEVMLTGKGTVTTFCITNVPSPGLEPPYVTAWIRLDGADITSMFLIQECDPRDVRLGMRVEPVWAEEKMPNIGSIKYYRPTGEPDAPYDDYKDYI